MLDHAARCTASLDAVAAILVSYRRAGDRLRELMAASAVARTDEDKAWIGDETERQFFASTGFIALAWREQRKAAALGVGSAAFRLIARAEDADEMRTIDLMQELDETV